MVLFNYGSKEITAKIVYYGPGLGGKTTNLQNIHQKMNPNTRGKLLSLATETDRTLFFDFLPVNLGMIRGFTVRFQLYTVPGQVYYNATRRLVLKGADAVVFVADSQTEMMEKNLESLDNMKENLIANGLDPETIPCVIQYNKRDLPGIMDINDLNRAMNYRSVPHNAAVAVTGEGVLETFKLVTKELIQTLRKKHDIQEMTEVKQRDPVSQAPPCVFESGTATGTDGKVLSDERAPSPSPVVSHGSETTGQIMDSVQDIQRQIGKIETQLSALIKKDEAIQKLLEHIREKLETNHNGGRAVSAEVEEPIILKEKKLKKKGFFWNR